MEQTRQINMINNNMETKKSWKERNVKKEEPAWEHKVAMKVSGVSIAVNLLLSLFKLLAGILAHSGAMISDAIHSASDVGSTFVVIVGVNLSSKKSDKEILELTILAMIFIYSLTEALTFSLVISIVTLIYGLVKKSNPLIVFGIITFVISMIVNLFRIFDNLALVFIILGFGIALISYVFYKETKKNKN